MRGRLTAIAVAAVSVILYGCANDPSAGLAPVPPSATAPGDASAGSEGLLSGLLNTVTQLLAPPTYFDCQNNGGPYTGSALIGSSGGSIAFGPHTFTVPAGALSKPTVITATTVAGDTVAAVMQPSGLTFAKPATLSLDISHCSNAPANDSTLSMVYVSNDLSQLLSLIPTLLNQILGQNSVIGSISHFSVYAVAERH